MSVENRQSKQQRKPHVVILGGGFGGLEAAKALRRTDVKVTLVDRNNHYLFAPLLYQVATAGLSPADIAAPIRSILRDQKNATILMGEITGIDPQGKRVSVETLQGDTFLDYDYLIVSTGSRHSYFGHQEWEPFAPGLKTIRDATDIRQKVLLAFESAEFAPTQPERDALMTFVVVGGGPTGAEMAGAIAELAHRALSSDFRSIHPKSARIVLVEAGKRILSGFNESLSQKSVEALKNLGVEVKVNARVECVDGEGVIINGERLNAKTVIWAAGVQASPAGKWLQVPTDKAGRVIVSPLLNPPNLPDVYVIGDTMAIENTPLPGVAQVAMQQGKYAAHAIMQKLAGKPFDQPFHYFDKGNLATIGRAFAIFEKGKVKIAGFIAWVLWLGIHIWYLIGFRSRISVMIQWAWAYFTFQRGARLIALNTLQARHAQSTENEIAEHLEVIH